MTTASLICEGPCNPVRPMVDTEVKALRRDEMKLGSVGHVMPIPEDLVRDLRSLRYTRHVFGTVAPLHQDIGMRRDIAYRWRCTVCDTMRTWGNANP
jgi:hypothetical protein